jgi:hypothetical protein
MVNTRNSECNG